jgi:hypothetical protein
MICGRGFIPSVSARGGATHSSAAQCAKCGMCVRFRLTCRAPLSALADLTVSVGSGLPQRGRSGPLGWGPDAKREVREGQEVDPGRPPVRQRFVTDGGVTVRVVKPAVHSGRGQRSARAAITRAAAMARGHLD